ncbi:MAG: hypothetical protein GY854_22875 [Deltaproteobacteria bacterium]|nr:hypothetical protein [Deltaproteobacteria bacterium]
MKRIIAGILRYTALVMLIVTVAFALPLAGMSGRLVDGLTDEETYIELVRGVGIAETMRKLVDDATRFIEGIVPGGEDGKSKAEDPIGVALGRAIDNAVIRVAAQVPAYVAGRRDHLDANVDLAEVRAIVLRTALERIPGSGLFKNQIESGVKKAVPERISLESPLKTLETYLTPLRVVVTGLYEKIQLARNGAFACLLLIVIIAFQLARAARFAGIALVLAGALGSWSAGLSSKLIGFILPQQIVESGLFQAFISRSITGFQSDSQRWIVFGGTLMVVSFATPFCVKWIGARRRSCRIGPPLVMLSRKEKKASIASGFAFLPAVVFYAARASDTPYRLAARSALGGRVIAAAVLDYLLFPMLIAGFASGLSELIGSGVFGGMAAAPLWLLLLLFWIFRDRPRTRAGINFTDRLAGVVRARKPGCVARIASLRRALPLIAAMLLGLIVPVHFAFIAVCAVEIVFVIVLWPDRNLGDLLAGTRARLRR